MLRDMPSPKRRAKAPTSFLQKRFAYVINRTARIVQSNATAKLKPLDLTAPQLVVLQYVVENPGHSLATIAERSGADPATLTELTKRLERRNMIRRERDPKDGRRALVFPHELDEQVLAQARALAVEVDHKALTGFTAEERRQFMAFLGRVADNLC